MRRILVEKARRARRRRHADGLGRVDLYQVTVVAAASDETLAVHEALDALAAEMPDVAELVELKYFAGLTTERAAEVLGVSLRTANRHWAFATILSGIPIRDRLGISSWVIALAHFCLFAHPDRCETPHRP